MSRNSNFWAGGGLKIHSYDYLRISFLDFCLNCFLRSQFSGFLRGRSYLDSCAVAVIWIPAPQFSWKLSADPDYCAAAGLCRASGSHPTCLLQHRAEWSGVAAPRSQYSMYSNFCKYATPPDEKRCIIMEKSFLCSLGFFLVLDLLNFFIWGVYWCPKKMAFRLAKNNSHLPVLLREFFRCCVFTVRKSSVNMQHPYFTVNMQHLLTDLLTDYTDW